MPIIPKDRLSRRAAALIIRNISCNQQGAAPPEGPRPTTASDAFYAWIRRLVMICAGYTKVWELAAGELVELDGARGTTLRVTRGTLWLTQEGDRRDIVLTAGDAFTIERGGITIVEAQGSASVCVLARHVDEVHLRSRRPTIGGRLRDWLQSVGAADRDRRFVPYL
jgi:hypothetical protein